MNKTHYKYDELQKTIQQQSIIIPSDLDEFIQTTVKGLPFMKRRLVYMSKRIMSYMVLLLVTITLLINFNEDIAAIAAEIPGLRLIEEVNKDIAAIIAHLPGIKPSDDSVGDLGAENALDNGYSEVQELVIVQGDYTLVLNHIIIDEERISFHSRLISDKLKYEPIEVEKSDQMSTVSQHKYAYNFSLPYTGSEVITYTNCRRMDGELNQQVTIQLQRLGNDKYITNLIRDKLPITLVFSLFDMEPDLEVMAEPKVIESFNIHIPIDEQSVLMSKNIELEKTIIFDEGSLRFNKMIISPTHMRLLADYYNTGDTYEITLDNYWLEDDEGNRYEMEDPGLLAGSSYSSSEVFYSVIPSSYYNKDIGALTLKYDSYRFKKEIEPIIVNQSMLPYTIHYGNYKVIITDMIYDQGTLQVKVSYSNDPLFLFQGFFSNEAKGVRLMTDCSYQESNKDEFAICEMTFHDVTERENYHFTMGYTMIIKEQTGQLELFKNNAILNRKAYLNLRLE